MWQVQRSQNKIGDFYFSANTNVSYLQPSKLTIRSYFVNTNLSYFGSLIDMIGAVFMFEFTNVSYFTANSASSFHLIVYSMA